MSEYFGGEPQTYIHQLLLDARDSYYAGEAKRWDLHSALKREGMPDDPIHQFRYIDYGDKKILFKAIAMTPNYKEQKYQGVGFTNDGHKFALEYEFNETRSFDEDLVDLKITNLHKKAQPISEIIDRLKDANLPKYVDQNEYKVSNGIKQYIAVRDSVMDGSWEISAGDRVVATFDDISGVHGFIYDAGAQPGLTMQLNISRCASVQSLEHLSQQIQTMEKEYMSTQSKEQNTESRKEKPKMFFAKVVADRLAEQLRDGKAPTQRTTAQNVPYNPCTGRSYHGINALNLMMEGQRDPRWMAFDEAKNAGYKVKAGEKGIPTQYWLKKKPGEKSEMQTTWLFNADQIQFIPPMKKQPARPDPYERVAEILNNCGATVIHDQKEKAFYNAARDEIHLPKPDSYKNLDNYCQDALNAYFHSTGHPSRLNRETFDSPKNYQQNTEELICAVSTSMMCAELGIPSDATKNPELATKWADNIEKYPIQFSQAMEASDSAVWRTMRQEQMRNIELNPHNNEAWRPVAEASPAIAVKTLLTQREVLGLADKEPAKVNSFDHDGVEVFTKPGTGYILSKTEIDTPGQDGTTFAMRVKTEGYDREGNTYDVEMEATVRKNESGLTETVKPPEAKSINLSTREMALPLDWNGKIEVSPCHEDESGTLHRGRSDEYPEFYGAFAEGDKRDVMLATFDRDKQAQYYASLVERQMNYQQERPQQQQTAQAEKGKESVAGQENNQANTTTREERAEPEQPTTQQQQEEQSEREQLEERQETKQDKEKALKDAKEKIAERLTEESQDTEKAVARIAAMVEKKYAKPNEPTPYMKNKDVGLVAGVYQNGNTTCVPLYNTAGELRSMAYISEKGKTSIAKGTEGEAKKCAHFDKKAVEKAAVVTFAVGLANSATITQAHNDKSTAMVTAMKDSDLPTLTAAFKQAYPDKQQVIFATNDHAYEKESGRNPGQYYAKQAAEKTGALVVSPRFAATETTKDFVNFNDLATKSEYGKEAVKEQTEGTVEKAKKMAAEKAQEQKQEKSRGNKELARG